MFLGEFSHNLDAKGRLFMPAKFREQLSETFVVARSFDTCLAVYPTQKWNTLCEKIRALPEWKSKKLARFLYPSACEAAPDAQGRILIPCALRDYAGLGKSAVVIGMGDYAEIWEPQKLDAARADDTPADIIEMAFMLTARWAAAAIPSKLQSALQAAGSSQSTAMKTPLRQAASAFPPMPTALPLCITIFLPCRRF